MCFKKFKKFFSKMKKGERRRGGESGEKEQVFKIY